MRAGAAVILIVVAGALCLAGCGSGDAETRAELERKERKVERLQDALADARWQLQVAAQQARARVQRVRRAARAQAIAEFDDSAAASTLGGFAGDEELDEEEFAPYYEEEAEEEFGAGCDPNYSGCVPEYPPDVDCPDVVGPVSVYGADPHGLDADGDGSGCE